MYDALYLSPHFDDAVLSCGAQIWDRVQRGQRIAVVTVCAAPAASGAGLSPFAASLHARWEQSGEVDREEEDYRALSILGAIPIRLIYQDCIYRQTPRGEWLYASQEAIFGAISEQEAPLVRELAVVFADLEVTAESEVFAPRAIGNHVDHQLVRQAAEAWGSQKNRTIHFYADYPYAEKEAGGQPVDVSDAGRQRKIKAISAYRSQISSFWPDREAMTAAVSAWQERMF